MSLFRPCNCRSTALANSDAARLSRRYRSSVIQAGVLLLIVAGICGMNGLMGKFLAATPPPPRRINRKDIWATTAKARPPQWQGRSAATIRMAPTLIKIALGSGIVGILLLAVGLATRN